jgi:hypothetical protein
LRDLQAGVQIGGLQRGLRFRGLAVRPVCWREHMPGQRLRGAEIAPTIRLTVSSAGGAGGRFFTSGMDANA